MEYVIYFDIASLLFMSVIIWRFTRMRRFPLLTNSFFMVLLILCSANIVLDILGTISISWVGKAPLWIPYGLNILFFISQLALPAALAGYFFVLLSPERIFSKKDFLLFFAPSLLAEAVFLVTIPWGMVFSISETEGYARGPLTALTYVNFAVYVVMSLVVRGKNRESYTKEINFSFVFLLAIEIACILIQFRFPSILLSGIAETASLTIMFFMLQNPEYMTDSVTDLYNYNAFLLLAGESLLRKMPIKMVTAELHGLRRVNTLYGMAEGDRMLKRVAEYLSENSKGWVFRTGESRFSMLTTDLDAYLDYLGRLTERRAACWPVSCGETVQMSFTICHLRHGEQFSSPEEMLNIVDMAMAEQKKSGEVIVSIDSNARADFNHKTEIENAVRESLQTGEGFTMFYQPMYSCIHHRFNGAEALLRFTHRTLGSVSPAVFIPVAAQSGLMYRIDEMVIKKVFADMGSGVFERLGYAHVHVNLSAASFTSGGMIETILNTAREAHIDPSCVTIEITETVAASSTREFASCMDRLRSAGFAFSLDDFGTGYSNISRLLQLPFDQVKLDKSLLDESEEAFTEIAKMLRNLRWGIVAEGVETAAQAKLAEDAGVSAIQGYYFSKPVPVTELDKYSGKPREKAPVLLYMAQNMAPVR